MGSVEEAQSILANFIEICDAGTKSHWIVLNGHADWDCSLQNVLGINCTTDYNIDDSFLDKILALRLQTHLKYDDYVATLNNCQIGSV